MAQTDTDTALFDESEMSGGGEATDMGGKALTTPTAEQTETDVGIPNAEETVTTDPNSSVDPEPNENEAAGTAGTAGDNNLDDVANTSNVESDATTTTEAATSADTINEAALQEFADQLSAMDDQTAMALVRGMPDESRQTFCAAVAGTLSDEQLSQCGLSKAGAGNDCEDREPKGSNSRVDDNSDSNSASDDSALQISMAKAKPEQMPGGTYMSLNASATTSNEKAYALELAQLKAEKLLGRARAVHAKNPNVITAEQIEQTEALLQGEKCLSLLKSDAGDLQPILTLVAMGERMVNGDNALLEVKTLNMSLTGAVGGDDKARPVDMTPKNSNGYDDKEANKLADERWGKNASRTTPAMIG